MLTQRENITNEQKNTKAEASPVIVYSSTAIIAYDLSLKEIVIHSLQPSSKQTTPNLVPKAAFANVDSKLDEKKLNEKYEPYRKFII